MAKVFYLLNFCRSAPYNASEFKSVAVYDGLRQHRNKNGEPDD